MFAWFIHLHAYSKLVNAFAAAATAQHTESFPSYLRVSTMCYVKIYSFYTMRIALSINTEEELGKKIYKRS